MQSANVKKKSLFSQRIKQVRKKQEQSNPFPKAIKINVNSQVQQQKIVSKKIENKRFVQRLLHGNLKEQEIEQIERDNVNSIKGMSEQEIKQYQQLIMKQMPPALLQKINKSKSSIPVKYQAKQKQEKQSVKQQMIDEANQINDQANIQVQQQNESEQNKQLGVLGRLALNIKTNEMEIIYQELKEGSQDVQTLGAIQLMIQSENNQTQIVGSKLLSLICSLVFNIPQLEAETEVVSIRNQYFHLTMIACDIYRNMIVPLMSQIKRTKFKSCWVEMMLNLLASFSSIKRSLLKVKNGQNYKQIVNFLKSQMVSKDKYCGNIQAMGTHEQNSQIERLIHLSQTVSQLEGYLNSYKSPTCSHFLNLSVKSAPALVIRLSLQLNQMKNKDRYGFSNLIQQVFHQSSNQHKQVQQHKDYIFKFIYPMALQLYKADMKSNKMSNDFIALKQYIYDRMVNQQNSKFLLQPLSQYKQFRSQTEQEQVYFKLFATKILSHLSYAQLLAAEANNENQTNLIPVANHSLANILTLLNLQQYFSPATQISSENQKAREKENVESMLKFIESRVSQKETNYLKQVSYIVLFNCLTIFTNYLHPLQATEKQTFQFNYTDLDENILNSTLNALCKVVSENKKQKQVWAMISEQTVKNLINSYNYNSFGHYAFTRILFFLIAACPHGKTIALMLEEVVARYPFLFYYALEEEYYGSEGLYQNGIGVVEMREIYGMLVGGKRASESNILVRYLRKADDI